MIFSIYICCPRASCGKLLCACKASGESKRDGDVPGNEACSLIVDAKDVTD